MAPMVRALSAVARRRISCCSDATGRSMSPWKTRPPPLLIISGRVRVREG